MPGWFVALSIGRKIAVLIALIAALAALTYGVNRWLDGIRESGRNEIRAQWAAEREGRAKAKADMQVALTAALQPQFDQLSSRLGQIDTTAAKVSVQLPQAIAAAPRYSDAACALTAPVLDQVNAARQLSAQPAEVASP